MKPLRHILSPAAARIREGKSIIPVAQLQGASKALFLSGLQREAGRPVLVITAREESAVALVDDLRFFDEQGALFFEAIVERPILSLPPWGVLPFEADSPAISTVGERMRFLYHLISGAPGIFVVPVTGLMQKLPPWEAFADAVITLSPETAIDPDHLAVRLVALGYESASLVSRVGEFSRRGGIIDIFSPAHENPLRFELFGDAVESLREFDPESQRSLQSLATAVILPVKELLPWPKHRAEPEGVKLTEDIAAGTPAPGAEFLAPFLYRMDTLFRYLPEESLLVLDEPDDLRGRSRTFWEKILSGREEEAAQGRSLPEAEDLYLDMDRIDTHLRSFPVLSLSLLSSSPDALAMDTRSSASLGVRLTRLPGTGDGDDRRPGDGAIAGLVEKLKLWREKNDIFIVCGTEESRDRIKTLFGEYGLGVETSRSGVAGPAGPRPVMALIGRISNGFSWPALGTLVIAEDEIFGAKVHRPRTQRSKASPFLSTFKELRPGDFVVHRDHGVGEYQGLTHIAVDGFETDYLTLRYEPDAKLHVPLYSLDKVQKYVGVEGSAPKVDRLGTPAWKRTRERVKKDILEMARELAAIYAVRESMERPTFSPPDTLYREFAAAFPFDETPDQQRAIDEVLEDMRKPRPMDRLVCGDVGFGKTEVALRAAFKAVEDGVQAAVLVPTTLLADQHFRTFAERLAPFSVRIDLLSRFRTKAEQKETLAGLKNGTVDIVIGTHRLLQRDIAFKSLGLLVVDEEHRFGVRHKERIKELKKMVDVLTLTATPIPRTLHLSLAGIRDLSIIQTPPMDRQSIEVVLARFGPRVIREAIEKEIERGGQVFFVHNRVRDIDRIAEFLRSLVPAARVGVGHGQMKDEAIEMVMSDFVSGRLNVLVTTTIIESGIDIPAANTIIINRADRFGLAELYQIKGRVGRSREKAFAYLLTPAEEVLSDVARQRLRAIQELSELGAGFRIAAQDLESRGAGNLLGKQQSGHIAAVGIDLYTQMMEEAMAELRGEEVREETDTIINFRASAFLPDDYIADPSLRLAAYKEIAGTVSELDLASIADGLRDRYGALPEQAANLLAIMEVKIAAGRARVARIDAGPKSASITFSEDAKVPPDRVMALLKRSSGKIKFVPEYTLQIVLPDPSLATAAAAVKKCLQELF